MSAPAGLVKSLYESMTLIRVAEERIAELYREQEMRCPMHLSIGQEAVAAGVCAALGRDDAVFLSHRCHAGYIAKGGDLGRMIAELYGKEGGSSRGRGGSMHLIDPEAGVSASSAILAGTVPIACGAALAFSKKKTKRLAAAFFGDAAAEEGALWESVSLAALWKLPVIFVCENNGLSTTTPISRRQPPTPIFERALSFGCPALAVDGNDALAVHAAAAEAAARARAGAGPTFIEAVTYRWLEHVGPNPDWDLGYRSRAEVEAAMRACPIKRFEAEQDISAAARAVARAEAAREVEAAVKWAKKSPLPRGAELVEDVARHG